MIKNGFKFKVKFVKHLNSKGYQITSFSISDKVRNGVDFKYQNYNVTVWGEYSIQDDEEVVLENIRNIDAYEYNGKVYIGITADIKDDSQPQPPAHREKQQVMAKQQAIKPNIGNAADDDTRLPFDI